MEMTMMEKMKYAPKEGDVLVYLDGTNYQIEKVIKTHVKIVQSGSADDAILKPIAHLRGDMIRNECFLCRKPEPDEAR